MARKLKLASISLDIEPAPPERRLERAERQVAQAAAQGAQLAALPELFNAGYRYQPQNYSLAESLDGLTVSWLKASAARYGLHLAGSLLLRADGEIYNAMLLVAPDGQMWRYDKSYPWGWERAYFRAGGGPQVAETALGRIGMLVCWDVAHPDLWQAYAGQVDWVLACSCPPRLTEPEYRLPDGRRVSYRQLGPLIAGLAGEAERVFVQGVRRQAAWLGTPFLCASGSGRFRSRLPAARRSLALNLAFAPWLARYLHQAGEIEVEAGMAPAGCILAADGATLATAPAEGDGQVLAEIALADAPPQPATGTAPKTAAPLSYLLSDRLLPAFSQGDYRRWQENNIAG